MHLFKVEWQGTWHGSRVKLLEKLLCMAAWLHEKKQEVEVTQTFILGRDPDK